MAEGALQDPNAWKTQEFRQKIIAKLDEVIRNTGAIVQKGSGEWESRVFQQAKTGDEYVAKIAQIMQHLQTAAENKSRALHGADGSGQHYGVPVASGIPVAGGVVGQPGAMQTVGGGGGIGADPINALQNLTRQPVPAGMSQPGLAPGHPGMAPGVPAQMVSAPGQRVPFAGMPPTAAAARVMQPGQPRPDMAAMPRPNQIGQSGYVMIPQQANFYAVPQMRHTSAVPYSHTIDMAALGPMTGSPAAGLIPGTNTMLSPGAHSPGPPASIAPSPSQTAANVPSPGMALNTPGNPISISGSSSSSRASASHLSASDEHAYLEKWKQLQKYVEPLKRMINKIDKDEDREVDLIKMKNLLNILSDSSKRLPMQTLLKCEQVLEKLDFNKQQPPLVPSSEHMCQPLLDAVAAHLKSPMLNHTLQRTFGPAVRTLHGPPLRTESPSLKRRLVDEPSDDTSSREDEMSDIIYGEIARLHHRFVVNVDPSQHPSSKVVSLLCRLEDKKLPSVRPIRVTVPENYPENSPTCSTLPDQPGASPFLRKVDDILNTELKHMPGRYSLTALLNMWELCVRKACAPVVPTA